MVFGLALVMALVVGVATAALAGTGIGATFNLGKINTVNRISQLVGAPDNAMLRVDNNSAGSNATALDLQVEPGHAPMRVNSSTQVANLNASWLDGKSAYSFLDSSVYKRESSLDQGTGTGNNTFLKVQACDAGDPLLSGGAANVSPTSHIVESYPSAASTTSWTVRINNNGAADSFSVVVLCIDQY
jgi:hypothetical protein